MEPCTLHALFVFTSPEQSYLFMEQELRSTEQTAASHTIDSKEEEGEAQEVESAAPSTEAQEKAAHAAVLALKASLLYITPNWRLLDNLLMLHLLGGAACHRQNSLTPLLRPKANTHSIQITKPARPPGRAGA